MGVEPEVGMGAVRFSLGGATKRDEIDARRSEACDVLAATG